MSDINARMHTAEHILTAVMREEFGSSRNMEMHLGRKKSKCDYEVPRSLRDEDITRIGQKVNSEIRRDHLVTTKKLPIEQARQRHDVSKVPDDVTDVRIVYVGDLDAIPCIGNHVRHTKQIGQFRISSYDMKRESLVRIRYKLGHTG